MSPVADPLPANNEQRRELLYEARGQRIQELLAEMERMREEAAKEKRLAAHRATLAESTLILWASWIT